MYEKQEDVGSSLPAILSCVRLLPPGHKLVLKALICFLSKVAQNSDKNCMSDKNIATCFAPAVVRRKDTPSDMSAFLAESRKGETLFQIFINNYHALFVCIPSSLSTFLFPSPYFLGFPLCYYSILLYFFHPSTSSTSFLPFHSSISYSLLRTLIYCRSMLPFTFVIVSKLFYSILIFDRYVSPYFILHLTFTLSLFPLPFLGATLFFFMIGLCSYVVTLLTFSFLNSRSRRNSKKRARSQREGIPLKAKKKR